MSNHRDFPRMFFRLSRHIGLFVIGYLLATLLSASVLIITWQGHLLRDLALFAALVGGFSLLPALGVIAVVKWRRLNPLKSMSISAGIVGFTGAFLVSLELWDLLSRNLGFVMAFIAISTLSGAASGLVLWFFTLRRTSPKLRADLSEKPVATGVTDSV